MTSNPYHIYNKQQDQSELSSPSIRERYKSSINQRSPFRRRLQSDLMIGDGELELGGSLVDPLQAFPDGAHGCCDATKPRFVPAGLFARSIVTRCSRGTSHCRRVNKARFVISATHESQSQLRRDCRSSP